MGLRPIGIKTKKGEMSWRDKYTEEQLEVIAKSWTDAPPGCCTGKCKLGSDFAGTYCGGCIWDDLPATGYENEIDTSIK